MFDTLKRNLEKNGYETSCFETKEQAVAYLNKQIDGTSVGFGGSVTVEELGLFQSLGKHNQVFSHMKAEYVPEGQTGAEVIAKAQVAKVYFSSVNAIAESGEIINIDGRCNRVASIFYGHEKVYLVVGRNKIAKTVEEAYWRARNIAAPKNAQRLNKKTPCAIKADKCYNCSSPERICNGLVALWKKPGGTAIEVVLINENLGY